MWCNLELKFSMTISRLDGASGYFNRNLVPFASIKSSGLQKSCNSSWRTAARIWSHSYCKPCGGRK